MEVSSEIKEEIRKTQNDLKNAIRIHQVWVARLKDDRNNSEIKSKIKDAEKEILHIGHNQKKVVERLRHELELYQQRLKARNKQVNAEFDHRHIAQQLREHQSKYRSRTKSVSLLKPSVLSEIKVKTDNTSGEQRIPEHEQEYVDHLHRKRAYSIGKNELDDDSEFIRATENFSLKGSNAYNKNKVQDRRTNLVNALNKAKQSLILCNEPPNDDEILLQKQQQQLSPPHPRTPEPAPPLPSVSPRSASPTPSPPPALPPPGQPLTQETFLRALGLVTQRQRQIIDKKRSERKKRSTTSTNKNEFIYGNFDMPQKRKKNNFPYLQQNIAPPQTRSQKMRRQLAAQGPGGSPPASPPPWPPGASITLPTGLTIEPVHSPEPRSCTVCRQNDTPSLLVHCPSCSSYFHSSCGGSPRQPPRSPPSPSTGRRRRVLGLCPECGEEIREALSTTMTVVTTSYSTMNGHSEDKLKEKLVERRLLQERNKQLTSDLRKLEDRADSLKENLESRSKEKKQLLSEQLATQKNLQKLLEFVGQFKGTSMRSLSTGDIESSRSGDDDY